MFRIKVVEHWIPYKKVGEHICLSPPRVELGSSKDCHSWKIIRYKNIEVDSLEGSTLPKVRITPKNASSKCCWALNSTKKLVGAYVYPPPRSGARGLQRMPSLKYYYVQKWQSIFILHLAAAKNTHYIQKCFK